MRILLSQVVNERSLCSRVGVVTKTSICVVNITLVPVTNTGFDEYTNY